MDMDDIFQEFLLSVGISVAVCCMIMKLKPYGEKHEGESFKKSYDEFHEGVELQDLIVEKEVVCGDESKDLCNVINVVSEIVEDVGVSETLKLDNHEKQEKANFGEIEEISRIWGEHREMKEEDGMFDDWEGVERTELEKLFGTAVVFVDSKGNAGLINRDTKNELYGLLKIAIEGPCKGPQPMSFNVSARAKWNSWKRLGNMRRELAMEQYLVILSEQVPGWMKSSLPR